MKRLSWLLFAIITCLKRIVGWANFRHPKTVFFSSNSSFDRHWQLTCQCVTIRQITRCVFCKYCKLAVITIFLNMVFCYKCGKNSENDRNTSFFGIPSGKILDNTIIQLHILHTYHFLQLSWVTYRLCDCPYQLFWLKLFTKTRVYVGRLLLKYILYIPATDNLEWHKAFLRCLALECLDETQKLNICDVSIFWYHPSFTKGT